MLLAIVIDLYTQKLSVIEMVAVIISSFEFLIVLTGMFNNTAQISRAIQSLLASNLRIYAYWLYRVTIGNISAVWALVEMR